MPSPFQGVAHQALEVDALLRHAGEDALVVLVEKVVDAEVDAQPLQRSLARLPGEEDVVHVVGVALLAGIVDLVELGGESAAPADQRVDLRDLHAAHDGQPRSEEHTSELQSLMRISYAVFCLKKKNTN